jgi:Tfp pilus assembly protein PilZ
VSDERRKDRRVPLLIDLNWEGKSGKYEARTSDLSTGGCFVDTIGAASAGDIITFKLQLPNGEWMEIEGEVTFASPRVGFGIRFTNITDANRKRLEWLLKAAEYQEDKSG